MTGPSDHDQRRHIRRLVSLARALDGVAALCPACHRDVPGVDGVVLTCFVAYAGWIILSDSGPNGDQLEDLHATLGEGPRTDVVATGKPIAAADLVRAQEHAKWPRFAARALACGIRAVFAFPVQFDTQAVGVLSVYRATAGPLSAADHNRVNRYAHTATVLLRGIAQVNSSGAVSMPLPDNAAEVQQARRRRHAACQRERCRRAASPPRQRPRLPTTDARRGRRGPHRPTALQPHDTGVTGAPATAEEHAM